jgi:Flp pilus assembly pilin Flp
MIIRLLTSDKGASMAEYAFVVTLIAMAALLAVAVFGQAVSDLFDQPDLLSALAK